MDRREFANTLLALGITAAVPFELLSDTLWDYDALNFIAAIEKKGVIYNDNKKLSINAAFKNMKQCGFWDTIDSLYVFTDPDIASINWKNP